MFDTDQFLQECVGCLREVEPRRAIRDVLTRAVARPDEIADRLRPESAGITLLYHSPELTIIDVVWAPSMSVFAHDHRMWAVIGIYAGSEDNEFFRRGRPGSPGLVPSNAKTLHVGDVAVLGDDTIHAVTNPLARPSGAIHVYGGDFVAQPRSQWRPPTLAEEPYDAGLVARVFAEANTAWSR